MKKKVTKLELEIKKEIILKMIVVNNLKAIRGGDDTDTTGQDTCAMCCSPSEML